MIQSGYCLIDLSWWNSTDYTQNEYHTDENTAPAFKELKAAVESGKIIFIKLGNNPVRVLTNVSIQTLMVDEYVRFQTFEVTNINSSTGEVTYTAVSFEFVNDGKFMWKIGGIG